MAQFDVHRNDGKERDRIPFIVVVQSALYDDYRRRVVVPLVRESVLGKIVNKRFNPVFKVKGISVALHPLEIVSVPVEKLGEQVATLVAQADLIIDALDGLITRTAG